MDREANTWGGEWFFMGPFGALYYPTDCEKCLELTYDGDRYCLHFYKPIYGERMAYHGRHLPSKSSQWYEERYRPDIEIEVRLVKMATRHARFRDMARLIPRPRFELCAILNFHDYPGLQYLVHGDSGD